MRILSFLAVLVLTLLVMSCAEQPEGLEGSGVYMLVNGEEWLADDFNATINRDEGFYQLVATSVTQDISLEIEVEDTQIGDYDGSEARIIYQDGSRVYRSEGHDISVNIARISTAEGITAGAFEGILSTSGEDDILELENGEYDGVRFVEVN